MIKEMGRGGGDKMGRQERRKDFFSREGGGLNRIFQKGSYYTDLFPNT